MFYNNEYQHKQRNGTMTEESWKRFKTLLKNASHAVAFTGAGVSTLSGIRDFRGKNGLYKQPETEKMFDTELFRRDPSIYYRLAKDFIYGLDEKQPCAVHRVLADWERRGILSAVITQNIDLLHQKAGSRRVIEVHGSPRFHFCLRCGERVPFQAAAETARRGEVPLCPKCGGVLKPEITFFGDSLPEEALREAWEEASAADVMLVLGSSLTVFPAAALPDLTLKNGGKLIVVNDQPTRADAAASLRFSDLGEVFDRFEREKPFD